MMLLGTPRSTRRPRTIMQASFILLCCLLVSPTGAQIYNQKEAGCGNKFETLTLNCQNIGNKVQLIQVHTITVTYKTDCPFSQGIDECYHIVPSTDTFYQDVLSSCQGKESCYVVSRQIPIPLCYTVIHFGNFVEVSYDCIPNGVTVPTTSTTTTTTTPAPTLPVSATSPLSTDAPGVIGSTSVSSSTTTTLAAGDAGRIGQDDVTTPASPSNVGTVAAIAAVVSIILILIIITVIITVFYRKRKLPYKMQTGLRDRLDAIGDKARYVSAAAVRLKSRLGHNDSDSDKSSSKVGVPVEEDIYTSIDELKGPQYASTYQDWTHGKSNDGFTADADGELPAILVISGNNTIRRNNITSITVPEEEPTDYEDELDDDDDGGWGDSEFDDDSADEYTQNSRDNPKQSSIRKKMRKGGKPKLAPKPPTQKISVSSINTHQSDNPSTAAKDNNTQPPGAGGTLPNQTGYQGLKNGTLNSNGTNSHHYSETGGGGVAGIDEDYYSIAASADEDYYTTAADAYDEAQPVAYASHC